MIAINEFVNQRIGLVLVAVKSFWGKGIDLMTIDDLTRVLGTTPLCLSTD
jgi:hypothetical protein